MNNFEANFYEDSEFDDTFVDDDYLSLNDDQLAMLESLEKDLEDYYYEDGVRTNESPEGPIPVTLLIVPDIAAGVALAIFTILALFLMEGIIRYAYTSKAVCVCFASILRIANVLSIHHHQRHFFGIIENENENALVNNKPWAISSNSTRPFRMISVSLKLLDELIALILLKEVHACTCKMELRERDILALVRVGALAALLSLLVSGSQELLYLIPHPFSQMCLLVISPLESALSFGVTVSVLYYGCCIVASLNKSNEFRNNSSAKSDNKRGHLVIVVVIVMSLESLKCLCRVARFITMSAMFFTYENCAGSPEIMADVEELLKCDNRVRGEVFTLIYLNTSFFVLGEFLCIFSAIARKKGRKLCKN